MHTGQNRLHFAHAVVRPAAGGEREHTAPISVLPAAAGWHIAHAALRTDMRLLADALAALLRSLNIQKPLLLWQVRYEQLHCTSPLEPSNHDVFEVMSSVVVYAAHRLLRRTLRESHASAGSQMPDSWHAGERSEELLVAIQRERAAPPYPGGRCAGDEY